MLLSHHTLKDTPQAGMMACCMKLLLLLTSTVSALATSVCSGVLASVLEHLCVPA